MSETCSFQQVFFGLQQFAEREFLNWKTQLSLEMPFSEFLNAVDDVDLVHDIADQFAVDPESLRLDEFFSPPGLTAAEVQGALQALTVGDFVRHLQTHLPPVSLEPLKLAGVTCRKAAAFLAIQKLAQVESRFMPSSLIDKTLTDQQIIRLWDRLRWATEGRLPPMKLDVYHRAGTLKLLGWLCKVISIPLHVCGLGIVASLLTAGWLAFWGASGITMLGFQPLPPFVITFRDLATLVAYVETHNVMPNELR